MTDPLNELYKVIQLGLAADIGDYRARDLSFHTTRDGDVFWWWYQHPDLPMKATEIAACNEYFQELVDQIQHPAVTLSTRNGCPALRYDLEKAEEHYLTSH